jgi:hypothetical protein
MNIRENQKKVAIRRNWSLHSALHWEEIIQFSGFALVEIVSNVLSRAAMSLGARCPACSGAQYLVFWGNKKDVTDNARFPDEYHTQIFVQRCDTCSRISDADALKLYEADASSMDAKIAEADRTVGMS